MRRVDCPIEEKRLIAISGDELLTFLDHHVEEKLTIPMDFGAIPPEVMTIGACPVKEVRVIVDATSHVAE